MNWDVIIAVRLYESFLSIAFRQMKYYLFRFGRSVNSSRVVQGKKKKEEKSKEKFWNDNCNYVQEPLIYKTRSFYCGKPVGVGWDGGCGGGGWEGGAAAPSVLLPVVTECGTESCGVVEWACWTGSVPPAAAAAAAA